MPWPKETRYLGKSTPRAEGPAKVSGRAKYTSDVKPAGLLHGAVLRSRWPAAHIKAIDLAPAKSAPGVVAAILLREGEFDVRFYGEELAAVAATTKQAALDALALIRVEAEPKKFVVDELDAVDPESPRVFAERPNLNEGQMRQTGDVDAAFASAAAVVEGTFSTQVELHHPLEANALVASFEGEEATVWASTQAVFGVRDGFARAAGVPQNKVRVICEHMGGGFGAKGGFTADQRICALLAKVAGAPVRLVLSRFEEALAAGNRPSSYQKLKLAADADGKLTAFQMEGFGTPGFGASAPTAAGGSGVTLPMPYLYRVPAVRVKQSGVAVNAGASCAMRAPAHPPASFGMESIMDALAWKLDVDPLELRLKNDPSETRRREYQIGAEKFGWTQKYRKPGSSPGTVKIGIGCAGNGWNSNMSRNAAADVQINADGTVEVHIGTQDLGTGSRTVVRVIAAEMLGVDLAQVSAVIGDSRFPVSPASGGSTTTASISPAVFDACEKALAELKKVSGVDEPRGVNWKAACAKLGGNSLQVRGSWREGLALGGGAVAQGGVQFAEVEVDTETGFVKVRKVLVVQDCGLVVNKLTCESQINGGVIMGVGYALYEKRVLDRAAGVLLNTTFENYKLPGAADIPEIEIVLLDQPERGVIGVGEPCTVPTASAIANAVANALGVRIPSLPITPDKVLVALGKAPPSERSVKTATLLDAAFERVAQVSSNEVGRGVPAEPRLTEDGGRHVAALGTPYGERVAQVATRAEELPT